MTGLNRSNLSLIERGLREPGIEMFQKILDALDAELTITLRKGTE
jgi:transcriptional regulator with XRE-family HTH domain